MRKNLATIGAVKKALWIGLACILNAGATAQVTYRVERLDRPAGSHSSSALSINDAGYIGGFVGQTAFSSQAALWSPDGVLSLFGSPTSVDERFVITSVSNFPIVAGTHVTASLGVFDGFVLDAVSGSSTVLSGHMARAMNSAGEVLVNGRDSFGRTRAFLWSATAGYVPVPGLGASVSDFAYDMNERGDVVGTSNFTFFVGPWVRRAGVTSILSGLDNGIGRVAGTNSASYVAGVGFVGGAMEPALWNPNGSFELLGKPVGYPDATGVEPSAVSDENTVIGSADVSGQLAPWVWTADDGMTLLEELVDESGDDWVLGDAHDINAHGIIVGEGVFGGATEAYLLRPVTLAMPESFTNVRGFVRSGGLSDLLWSDDDKLVASAGITLFAGESPLQVVVTGSSPLSSPAELRFKLEAKVSTPGLLQTLDLFNYETGLYEEVDFWAGSPSDSVVEVMVETDATRFVDPATGAMKAKVSYRQVGIVSHWPWRASIDQAVWTVSP